MEELFQLLVICMYIFACASGFYCFFGVKVRSKSVRSCIVFSIVFILGIYIYLCVLEFKIWHCIAAAFLWCMFQLGGTVKERLKILLLEINAFPIIGNVVLYGSEIVSGGKIADYEKEFISDILISIFLWILYWVRKKEIIQIRNISRSVYWTLFFSMLVSAFMVTGCSYFLNLYIDGFIEALLLFFISGVGIVICIMIGMIFYIIHRNREYDILLQVQEEYIFSQKQYYLKLLEKEEDTRRFRHDISNHLLAVYTKLKADKGAEACQYIKELQTELQKIRKKNYDVGNDLMNAMLNYYFDEEDKCASVSGYLKEPVFLSEVDLCTIISNLLKNALEYSDWSQEVSVNFEEGEHSFCIEACNMTKENVKMDVKTGFPVTVQKDRNSHGLGLRNVSRVVEKYNGKMEIEVKERRFCIRISFVDFDR